MNKRPHSVTVIGILFLAAGSIGLAYHATELKTAGPFPYDAVWVCLVRLLAIIGSVFMLRGANWARWLLVIWLAYHVILSGVHSAWELIVHGLLLAVIAWFLFRRPASVFFGAAKAEPAKADHDSTAR